MPQMGESIAEGTISKWLKQVGDVVERDEPILEISTDKVDAEIPAPQGGTLVEIKAEEGETVEVGTVVAFIETEAGAAVAAAPVVEAPVVAASPPVPAVAAEPPTAQPSPVTVENLSPQGTATEGDGTAEERLRTRSTPVVRKIAEEHGIAVADVAGSGHAGRVTKQDILEFIESGGNPAPAQPVAQVTPSVPAVMPETVAPAVAAQPPKAPVAAAPTRAAAPSESMDGFWKEFFSHVQHPEFPVRQGDTVEAMDKIRRLTAEHMVLAKRVAPHVHSFIEIDFSRIDQIRAANKAAWAQQGARVSYTAFVVWACSRLLRKYPAINGTVSGNNLIHRANINLGMAVDLNPGLIVPVMHDTDHLSLVGIGMKIIDLAERARGKKLMPAEIQGATFSITNPGVLGTMVGMPVIPKGTSAILGTGSIEKRPVVVVDPETGADAIAIRKRSYFSLGYDHRIVDGAEAARFLAELKDLLEEFPEDA